MKFAFMSRILPYEGYGVQTFLVGLINGIAKLRCDHEIILFTDPIENISKYGLPDQFRIVPLWPSPQTMLSKILWDHFIVGNACRRLGIDALYAPAHVRPLLTPCPTVVTIHDMMYHLYPKDWDRNERLYFQTSVSLLTSRAAALTADSESTRQDILGLLNVPPDRITVVYPGIPEGFKLLNQNYVVSIRHKYNLHNPFILYVGSFHPRKNLASLLDAYGRLMNHIPHDLVVVGLPIWQNTKLESQIRDFKGRVRFIGFVPRCDLPLIYNAADVFVMPSRYEGFGFPVLEALSCGCPTITTNVSSLPEVAGDAALLVTPDDVPMLAEAIRNLIYDIDLRNKLRENGLNQVKKFSWLTTAQKIVELLERVA